MKKNIGLIDKLIRILAAIAIIILYLTNSISGIMAIVLLIIAGTFILTSIMGICPLYLPFKISTNRK